MKELVEAIARALVDNPDQVQVRAVEGELVTVFELRVHTSDLGKVIGRQGRTAQATILNGASMKLRKRFRLEILECVGVASLGPDAFEPVSLDEGSCLRAPISQW